MLSGEEPGHMVLFVGRGCVFEFLQILMLKAITSKELREGTWGGVR